MSYPKDPMIPRKIDTTSNKDITEGIINQTEKEKKLFPLRINRNTIILVPKDKCNEEYAELYRQTKIK